MGKKEEQKKIKQLLVEAITLLCKDGLQYEAKFSVEALIGITLDDNDVVLVNINETFSNEVGCETSSSVSKRQRGIQSFDNQKPNQPISIKDEQFDEQGDFNNEEFDSNFQRNQDVDDENNYLNSDANNQNENNDEDENNQYDNSNMAENIMYIKSEGAETVDVNNWMMNNSNDFNNLELGDDINNSQQETPRSYTSRPGPYSLQMRRQRGRGRSSFRTPGQQRVRPQNNYMPSQQSSLDNDIEAELIQGFQVSKWQCSLCTSVYSSERVMKEHIKAIHLHKMLCHCKDCGQSFKWRHQLQKHRVMCPARFNSELIEFNPMSTSIRNSHPDDLK